MASFSATNLGIALSFLIVYLITRCLRARKHKLPLPPGPKGLPILGNLNDLPNRGDREWEHWLKHKDLYGPISSLTVLGQTFVILNDAQIALELLKDRAPKYAGRPHQVFAGTMHVFRILPIRLSQKLTNQGGLGGRAGFPPAWLEL